MKILFVSRLFHDVSGGVECMAIALLNKLFARDHDIKLFSRDRNSAETWYPLDKRIGWHRLDMGTPWERQDAYCVPASNWQSVVSSDVPDQMQ